MSLRFWLGETSGGEDSEVDDDEESLGASENRAVGALDLCLVKEFAAFAAEMAADEDEGLVERGGAEVVDLHVTSHGDDVEGAVELAHGFVKECGYDAAVDVSGGTFVQAS